MPKLIFESRLGKPTDVENTLMDAILALPKGEKFSSITVAVRAGNVQWVAKAYHICFRAFACSQEGKHRQDGCGLMNLGEGEWEWRDPSPGWPDWFVK